MHPGSCFPTHFAKARNGWGTDAMGIAAVYSLLERFAAALAGPYRIAASDISGVPLPAPFSCLHLRGVAERTGYALALRDRAIRRLRIRGLRIRGLRILGRGIPGRRILWLGRGRGRGGVLQGLPTGAAKAGREVYRCSTVRAEGRRRLVHDVLLNANLIERCVFSRRARNYISMPGGLPQSKSSRSGVLEMRA